MAKSTPSLLALLGLVAVAGYQNRGKISDMLSDARQSQPGLRTAPNQTSAGQTAASQTAPNQGGGGFLAEIGQMFQSGTAGASISGGLGELVNRFKTAGSGAQADSWVGAGSNLPMQDHDVASAIGDETLADLAQKTGLSRGELLRRLSAALPDVVNQLTPDGRLPSEPEAQALI